MHLCMYLNMHVCMHVNTYIYKYVFIPTPWYRVQHTYYLQVLQSTADTVLIDAMQGRHLILCCSHYDLTTHAMGDIVVLHIVEQ